MEGRLYLSPETGRGTAEDPRRPALVDVLGACPGSWSAIDSPEPGRPFLIYVVAPRSAHDRLWQAGHTYLTGRHPPARLRGALGAALTQEARQVVTQAWGRPLRGHDVRGMVADMVLTQLRTQARLHGRLSAHVRWLGEVW